MEFDLLIIGAGPAGYVAAIKAGQAGLKTAIIEKKHIGGMCLNWGCIPTKSILESAKMFHKTKQISAFGIDGINVENLSFNWEIAKARSNKITKKLTEGVNHLLNKNGVEIITGNAELSDENSVNVDGKKISAKNIIIATGSKPAVLNTKLTNAPHVEIADLFSLQTIPENIVVTGNHVSAVEISQFFSLIGKKVTLVANSDYFMIGLDDYIVSYILKKLKSQNIDFILNDYPEKYENGELYIGDNQIKCDLIVNCNSRKAIIPTSEIPLELTERGFIETNNEFKTNLTDVYAIGDVTGKSFVAHLASAQAIYVVDSILGKQSTFDGQLYPLNMFTIPEIAQIGLTEQEVIVAELEYKITQFPLSANAKALIEGDTEGFIRLISDSKFGQVLGVQIVGSNATDMIAEATAIMSADGTVNDIAHIIHAHPTVSEIYLQVGLNADEHVTNM